MSYNNSKTLTWLFFILQRSDKCQIYNWSSQTCSLTRRLFSQLVVTVLWITNIQAYMPCKSSENPTNQPHSAMGSPLHTYGPHRPPDVSLDPLEPLNIPLDLIGPLRSPVVSYKSSEDPSNVPVHPMGHMRPPIWPPESPWRPGRPPWPPWHEPP